MLEGELVLLGPLHKGLLPLLHRWENDLRLSFLTGDPVLPNTLEWMASDLEGRSKADPTTAHFAIYELATRRPVGTTSLNHINYMHRTAEFGIGIGEPDCCGRGLGTEATRLMLDYAFTAMGLHNVWLQVYDYNLGAIRAYQKAGFREIGRRREAHRIGPRAYDEILMDCLASQFESPLVSRLLPVGTDPSLRSA
jgi:diamine N-acetyltransferase